MADVFFGSPFRRLFWSPSVLGEWRGSSAAGAMDWIETPSSHILKINVPGFGRDDIKVQLEEGNVLSIRGEGSSSSAAGRGKGEFAREIALPDNAKAENIKASVDNGVLTIVIPKEPIPAKPKPRAIPISSKL
ncbi:16.0 kDa heat shock protein, peroxisomal [Ananas comosus]|uniref:16.0 kDa heat shock protein, peroxisomal n=1 Tax=Ananas comosus TaxID=4615 RepID=A0A6P5F505_ANACO|nr:16.0 kDa heat shock protein, peroxisomal [Ananas comosus]